MTPSERDRLVEQWLTLQPTPLAAGQGEACLDAEAAAAWADGMLAGAELERAQAHVAGCARCQSLMLTLLETEANPALAPVAQPAIPRWRGWFAWGAPLAAAAAGVVLAVGLWQRAPQPALEAPGASTGTSIGRPVEPTAEGQEARRLAPAPSVQPSSPAAEAAAPDRLAPAAPRQAPPAMAKSAAPAATVAAPALRPFADGGDLIGGVASGAAANAAGLDAARAPEAPPPPSPAPPPPPPPAPAGAAPQRADVRESAARLAEVTSVIVVTGPSATEQWRIAGARVERSVDGGRTWAEASVGGPFALVAGVAPARGVCWLVGRRGVVLLTVDGDRWQRLPFPETVDLASVSAAGAREARVSAADGRRFRTGNGGQSWVEE